MRTTAECLVKDALLHGPRASAQAYGQAFKGGCVTYKGHYCYFLF